MVKEKELHTGGEESAKKQYDKIGTKYDHIKTLTGVEPEEPSAINALGDVLGKKCLDLACGTGKMTALLARLGASSVHGYDISPSMIDGAKATYPPSSYPTMHFAVADCSKPRQLLHDDKFDIVFAGWFLNYAGTETELTNMFRVIEQNLKEMGKFVGITTNVHDHDMHLPKHDFYGLEIDVLDPAYIAPDTFKEVGVKAKVEVKADTPFSFEVFQFRKEVYERCAEKAGLQLKWGDVVLPNDERKAQGFWDRYLERPTFAVVEAKRK